MLETDATPTEVVNWFRSDRCRDEVLLLWVSGESNHHQTLQELLLSTPAIDSVLQDRVGFLFTSLSKAVAIRPGGLKSAPFFKRLNRHEITFGSDRVARIARATAQAAADFATFFELKENEVPALVVLVKHMPQHVVVPMGSKVALKELRSWISEIVASTRRHRERCDNLLLNGTLKFDFLLQKVMDADQSITAQRRKVRELLDGLIVRHPDVGRLGRALIDLVTKEVDFDTAKARQAVTALLQGAQHERLDRVLQDGRVQRLDRLLCRIEVDEERLRSALVRRQSIQDVHDQYQLSLEQLKKDIDGIRCKLAGSRLAPLGDNARSLIRAAPSFLNQTARILDALAKLAERLPRLS